MTGSSSNDFLNQVAGDLEAAEQVSDYRPHPTGEFHGEITSVESKYVAKAQNSVFEFQVKTSDDQGPVGKTTKNEWAFTDQEIMRAQSHQDDRDKLLDKIKRLKRLFVDCGVYTADQARQLVWADPQGNKPSIVQSFDKLVGQKCSVSVKPNNRDASKGNVVFLNAPLETVVGADREQAPTQRQAPQQHNAFQPPQYGAPASQYGAPAGYPPPPQNFQQQTPHPADYGQAPGQGNPQAPW